MNARVQNVAAVLLALATIAVAFRVHQLAGLTLPNPWNDEPWYSFPAVSFAETGSVACPYINPERPLAANGHGFSVILGTILQFTGWSLPTIRWIAWGFLVAAYAAILLLLCGAEYGLWGVLFASLFMLSSSFTVAGNVGRPDALMLALGAGAFLLLQRGRGWLALALALMSISVHFNGLYWAIGVFVWLAATGGLLRKPTRGDLVALALAVGACALSAWFILSHWSGFQSDFLDLSLRVKREYHTLDKMLAWPELRWVLLLAGATGVAFFTRRPAALPLLFGLCSLITFHLGREMWYAVFHGTAFLMLGLALIVLAPRLLFRGNALWARGVRLAWACALALLIYRSYMLEGFLEGPRNYPRDMDWGWGMGIRSNVAYLNEADVGALCEAVRDAAGERRGLRVEFPKTGDSLLLGPEIQALGHVPYLPIQTTVRGDVIVYHASRYIPAWIRRGMMEQLVADGGDPQRPVRERDGTEKWYVVVLHPAAPAGESSAL